MFTFSNVPFWIPILDLQLGKAHLRSSNARLESGVGKAAQESARKDRFPQIVDGLKQFAFVGLCEVLDLLDAYLGTPVSLYIQGC